MRNPTRLHLARPSLKAVGSILAAAALGVLAVGVPMAGAEPAPVPVAHEELSRALDELAGRLHGLGGQWREHFSQGGPGERPLISLMLNHRSELGLSQAQVDSLERLRTDFQREAVKRDADLRVAEMDLRALLAAEPVDLGQVEAKVRQIERLRADLRIGRIRTIEQGKAQLTPDQRDKLRAVAGESRPRAGGPSPAPSNRL